MNLAGKTTLFVRFGMYVVNKYFFVCDQLATAYVLGGDFLDRFLKYIQTPMRIVDINYGTEIPIVRK